MNYDMFTSNETIYIYFVILFWVKFELYKFFFTLFIQMAAHKTFFFNTN